jgi:pseudouridine-5'-phosphate glycosidase
MLSNEIIRIAPEVAAAVTAHKPMVALESTVIAHGLPRPTNLETAFHLEAIVRQYDVLPATAAVMNGQLCIGLNDAELQLLAEDGDVKKISTRDLPIAVANGWNGATTWPHTCWIAHLSGINVFDGWHRWCAPRPCPIFRLICTNSRTPIIVVCSGAKIVLVAGDAGWLRKTHGSVVGYQCDGCRPFIRATALCLSTFAPSRRLMSRG